MNEAVIDTVKESEEESAQEEKLVPVSESIRYRKRAQNAEQKAAVFEDELTKAKSQNEQLSEKLSRIEVENKLVEKLVSAGVSDLEAAISIAKSRIEAGKDLDIDNVVEQLRREKQHLFINAGLPGSPSKTSGVKQKVVSGQSVIERAAQRAARSGHRGDLLEYLKLRRNVV